MLVYKYRHWNNDNFESIRDNYYWASGVNKLNDPFETLVFSDEFESQISVIGNLFGLEKQRTSEVASSLEDLLNKRNTVGIYSLSTSWKNELIWAHYGDSHKGFCIEYDLEILLDNDPSLELCYPFKVDYSNIPPQIDFHNTITEGSLSLLRKLMGTKSKPWAYEEEFRIVTEKIGKHHYDFRALKSIFFGHRMEEKYQKKIMKTLQGRSIKYYKIILEDRTYKLDRKEVEDKFKNSKPYLFEIWRPIDKYGKNFEKIAYTVLEKKKYPTKQKATLKIELGARVTQNELKEIANELKEKFFCNFEKVFISYYIHGSNTESGYWAISNFYPDSNIEIKIDGLTLEQEGVFLKRLQNETRKTIGMWIDDTPFMLATFILFDEDGKIYLEIKYKDDSAFIIEMIQEKNNEFRVADIENNYIINGLINIDALGNLSLLSESGAVFKNLRKK